MKRILGALLLMLASLPLLAANVLPTVSIQAPPAFKSGAVIALTANAVDTDGTIASVSFYYVYPDTTRELKATLTASPYTAPSMGQGYYQYYGWTAGTHKFIAVATDNLGGVTESAPVFVTVSNAPTVAITSPANGSYVSPPTVTLSATASDSDGTISKVEFFSGATLVGTVTASPYNLTLSNVATGTYSYTAKATENNGLSTTSTAVTVYVDKPPTVSIQQPPAYSTYSRLTFTANAADADGTISSVVFYQVYPDNSLEWKGSATAAPYTITNIGQGYYQYYGYTAGSYKFIARVTDNMGAVTDSAPVTVVVTNPPTVSISSPVSGAYVSPPTVTLSATAADSDGSISKVEFFSGATLVGTVTASPYNLTLSSVATGTYSYTAKATDNNGISSTSATVTVYVDKLPTVSIQQPPAYGTGSRLSFTANAADADGTISSVVFYYVYPDNSREWKGSATAAPYTITNIGQGYYQYTGWSAGSHKFVAVVTDNMGAVTESAPVTVVVSNTPTVSISSPVSGTFVSPPTVTLSAAAADSDGTITKVEFFSGAALVGTVTASPYNLTLNNVVTGSYSYTAKATENNGLTATSAAVNITVDSAPTVSIQTPVTYPVGSRISLTSNAADADGTISSVAIYYIYPDNSREFKGSVSASPYTVSNIGQGYYQYTGWSAGTYKFIAIATDNLGRTTESAPVNVTVGSNVAPTVSITAPANGATYAAPAGFTLSATAADSDGTISKVEFYNGATLIGTITASPYNLALSSIAAGSYSYTAKAYDNGGSVTTSIAVGVTVTSGVNAAPTVSITAPVSGAVYNAPGSYTLTANAADSDGTISKVEFYSGATLIGTVTAAPYNLALTNIVAGSYSYTAKAYDNGAAVTTSAPVSVTVNALPTVSLTAPANGAVYNAPGAYTLTASASDSDGTISKVEFYNGATLLGTVTVSPFNWALSNLATGSYSYTAKAYDNRSAVTTSGAVAVTVNALPTVSLTAPANGAVYTAPAAYTLTASASDSDGTISKVEFYNGATLLGTVTVSPFNWALTNVAAGSYSYTAKAFDNRSAVTTSAVVGVTVSGANAAPTVSITAPVSGAVYNAPGSYTITASATDSDGTISKVEFYSGATLIGTVTAAPYNLAVNNVAAGSYSYTAKAYDNGAAVTTSAAVAVTVNALPTVSLTAPANGAVYNAPAAYTLTASASDSDGTISKVEFYNGATLLGTVTVSPFNWALPSVAAGSYSYTAKAYDNRSAVTTTVAVAVTVNALPTVSLTAPANGAVYNAPAAYTLTASASDSDGTISKVEFYNGATLLGTVTVSPFNWALPSVAAGSYSYTAKAYDNRSAVTTSAAVAVSVNALPTLSLTAPANSAVYNAPAAITLTASASDSDGTISKVEFYNGAALIGTVSTPPYTLDISPVAAGSYSYTAKAYDNLNAGAVSAAASVTVNAVPVISISTPTNNAQYTVPGSVTLTASATDADGTIAKVEYYNGVELLGTAITSPYSYSWTNIAAGTYTLTAKAYDNRNAASVSAGVTMTVKSANAAPTVSLTAPLNGASYAPGATGATITLTASASDSDGNISAVEFYDGLGALLNTVKTAPFTISLTSVATGTYSYKARAIDNSGFATTSSVITVFVGDVPGVALSSPANNAVYTAFATIVLSAAATDADGISKVAFYNGDQLLGLVAAAPYNLTLTGVAIGTYRYTAKATDTKGNAKTSSVVNVTVNLAGSGAIPITYTYDNLGRLIGVQR